MYALVFSVVDKVLILSIAIYYARYLSTAYWLIVLQVAIAIFCDSYGKYLVYHNQYNTWLYNYYMLAELWLTGSAAVYFIKKKILKQGVLFALLLVNMIWIIEVFHYGIIRFATNTFMSLCVVLIIIYTGVLFNRSIFTNKSIIKQPVFWLALSVILYFGCDLPYLGLNNYLVKMSMSMAEKLFLINQLLDITRYVLIGIGIFLHGYQHKKALKTA